MYIVATDGCIIDSEEKSYREETYWNGYRNVRRCSQYEPSPYSMQYLTAKDGK